MKRTKYMCVYNAYFEIASASFMNIKFVTNWSQTQHRHVNQPTSVLTFHQSEQLQCEYARCKLAFRCMYQHVYKCCVYACNINSRCNRRERAAEQLSNGKLKFSVKSLAGEYGGFKCSWWYCSKYEIHSTK